MKFSFHPKLLDTLPGYGKGQLSHDVSAGLTVGVLALPLAMAFAIASGMSPTAGIWTAIVAGFIISAFGGSRVQIGGPTGAFIPIIYAIVVDSGVQNLLVATMLAGAMLVAMGVFRLGNLIRFIPKTVVIGFTNGIAVVIFLAQIKDFLGLQIEHMPGEFFGKVKALVTHLDTLDIPTVALSVASLLVSSTPNTTVPPLNGDAISIVFTSANGDYELQAPAGSAIASGTWTPGQPISYNGFDLKLTEDARSILERYDWPGNVRELESAVEYILAVREGDEVLYLHKNPGRNGPEMRSRVGHRMALVRTGIGKAMLLDASLEEWRRLYEAGLSTGGKNPLWPDHPQPSWEQFEARMRSYVAGGYAFDLEDNEPSIRCVAAPIRDASGQIVAAISIASTVPYMPHEKMTGLIPVITQAAQQISAQLGG